MYEKILNCPVCDNNIISNYIICKDQTVSEESFAISECRNCGFKFTNPRPDKTNIEKYYESKDYISHSNASTNFINFAYKIARKFTLGFKYKILKKYYSEKGKLLDYGCGTGNFLLYCKNKGWDVVGIEPNMKALHEAEKVKSLTIYNSKDKLQDKEKFDVITLWHVLEHIHELKEVFTFLKSKINKNGIICIAMPNSDSYDCQLYKEFWAGYDVPRHLYHFNQATFKALIKLSKMKLLEVIPMKLDAYYVSMLSEKYKNKKNNYLRSVLMGYKSNSWAAKNNNNYSSLIYIIRK
ncbi:MAG: class I SAM-dependent methyltransferase [Bacteroidota bacterium]|nr:class I SAM-dependent methyltransferase [Bacteroidota bacterium]